MRPTIKRRADHIIDPDVERWVVGTIQQVIYDQILSQQSVPAPCRTKHMKLAFCFSW